MVNLDQARLHGTSQIISRQVDHLSGLLEDLLDVSRVTRGLVSLNRDQVDMKEVVSHAVEQLRPAMQAGNHQLEIELTPHMATLLGDKNRLVQVVSNLLSNAARYRPPN